MAIKIIYMVHGTTQDNIDHLASGHNDVELAPLGIEQAKKLGSQESTHFDIIFTSDLNRAITTALIAFPGRAPIIADPRLRECDYGDLTQKKKEWNVADFIDKKYPNGESYHDVETRMQAFLDDLKEEFEGKVVAIVAHQAPQLALEVIANKKTWQQAIREDWRNTKAWKPSWTYNV